MKLLRKLTLVLLTGLAFISCQKEYSEENGGAGSGEATGTLKAAGSGECLPSSVQGVFIAGTVVNTSNFINVDVDFTALGTYTITTNVVNGYSFSATGIATVTGVQTVKLTANASGIPVAAGANTFTVSFGGTQCNIVVDVYPAGTGNADLTINCAGVVLGGTYTQNTSTTSANTVQVEATVITAGLYNISTNTVNGVSFSGSGFLAAGTSMVTLVANGGMPTASGVQAYTVTAGTSTCTFDIDYVVGTTPPVGGLVWSFKAGGTTFSGTTDDAEIESVLGVTFLTISGVHSSGIGSISLTFSNTSGGITATTYSGTAFSGRFFSFGYNDGIIAYSGQPGSGSNVTGILDLYSPSTHVVEGRFSGSAKNGVTGTATIAITEGKFKANLP
jgi:hypothetical protein